MAEHAVKHQKCPVLICAFVFNRVSACVVGDRDVHCAFSSLPHSVVAEEEEEETSTCHEKSPQVSGTTGTHTPYMMR